MNKKEGIALSFSQHKTALACLEAMRSGKECKAQIVLPVTLISRESTRKMPCRTL